MGFQAWDLDFKNLWLDFGSFAVRVCDSVLGFVIWCLPFGILEFGISRLGFCVLDLEFGVLDFEFWSLSLLAFFVCDLVIGVCGLDFGLWNF